MMSFDDVYGLFIESILSSYTSTDFWMSPFDIVIHSLSEVMEKSSFESKHRICTDHPSNCFSDVGDFFRVHEDILSVTRPESEFTDEREDFVRNTDYSHFLHSLSSQVSDELICFFYLLLGLRVIS
jgi:hypothetical protein